MYMDVALLPSWYPITYHQKTNPDSTDPVLLLATSLILYTFFSYVLSCWLAGVPVTG
jgi:hypothetical protein